ncbi:MAG: saccharopine dehydrogenase NADP-binding domain-containing protein [Rhodocyclaceae bacterium]|nr:saccharopine dehydrogenase NADP-binding domain-containing protein [Rhodocyclaceae bacterium]
MATTKKSPAAAKVTARDRSPYDIVVFGATGFTGELTAEYLAQHGDKGLRWALAGRNPAKLEAVRARLAKRFPACKNLALLTADASDPAALAEVARATRVVITTVGPYLKYGEPLVAACAAAGTDYVDLTGEPEFVDQMWLRYHQQARKTGARIISCCGFDSIPHDLGAWFTVKQLPENEALKVEGFVRAGGEFSGGTLHSAVNAMSRIRQSLGVAKERREKDVRPAGRRIGSTGERIRYERTAFDKSGWAVPMPTIDPQVVRHSAAANARYGPDFRYGHYVMVKQLPTVVALVAGVGAMLVGAQFKPTRELLLKIKSAGDGPSEETRAKAWFKVRFVGTGGGKQVVTEVSGGDPGYGETSKMLAESALCLAFDTLPAAGGVLTPAQSMGDALISRLQHAGIEFKVISAS